MKKFYGTEIPGSLSPVPATPEMTQPVGVRDGQLFTDPGDVGELTDRVEALEQTTGTLEDNVSELQTDVGEAQSDIEALESGVSSLDGRMDAAESNIGTNAQAIGQLEFDVSQAQTDIVGLGLSKLNKPTNTGEVGDVIVKTAGGTEFQSVAPFNPNATYPNVTAGKAISAKSLENVSEDSGATQTEPFFFQATATANGTAETPTAPVFNLKSIRGNTIVYNQLVDGVTQTYPTISGHVYWFKHDPLVSLVTSTGTDINVPTPQSDKLVDLTRWFNGNIPQAILDDPTIFPINYYDGELTYSAGELKNCSCTELVSTEFNQLVAQPASLSTPPAHIDISNATRVFPNKNYCLAYTATGSGRIYVASYDGNGDIIAENNVVAPASPSFWYYSDSLKVTMYGMDVNYPTQVITFLKPAYIVVYKSNFTSFTDCNLNLAWDNKRNGEYAPYVSHTYPLVWSGKSAGSAYDEYLPDGTKTTRIGSVDLGSQTWGYDSTYDMFYCQISGKAPGLNNVTFASYDYGGWVSGWASLDKVYCGDANNTYFRIKDTSYGTDANAFKTAMSGVTMYYELATPTTSEGTPFTSEIEGDDYGTMSFDSVVPVGNEFFYPADYALLIDDIGNYTGYDVTKLMLKTDDVVPAAPTSDGTYVLKCVVSGGTPTYSWIAET